MKGHTGVRIAESVEASLEDLLGEGWRRIIFCCTTDGASNVRASARLLGEERPCLQHHLQLFLKWFCTTIPPLASAISACNYLARFTGISSKFREAVGRIAAGVVTRWNSYIASAEAVVKAQTKINAYTTDATADASVTQSMTAQTALLNLYGYTVLQDMTTLLKSLMDITIDEEGELYVTSSAVIPRLRAAKTYTDNVFREASGQRVPNSAIRLMMPDMVKSWQATFDSLWNRYLQKFMDDEILQAPFWLTFVLLRKLTTSRC